MVTEAKAGAIRYWEDAVANAMAAGMSARTVAKLAGVSHVPSYRVHKGRSAEDTAST